MSTIRYTHGFNLLYQFIAGWGVAFFGGIALTAATVSILDPVWQSIAREFPKSVKTPIEVVACIAIWIGCLCLLFKAVVFPLQPLPTWLYLRVCLLVPATWQDAKDTAFLFDGDGSGKWYPLSGLRKVPRQFRREVLHEFAEQVLYNTYGIPDPGWQPSSPPPPRSEVPPRSVENDSQLLRARAVLGVSADANEEQVKRAYRTLIKKYHPDVYAGSQPELQYFAHQKATELNAAYDFLMASSNGTRSYM